MTWGGTYYRALERRIDALLKLMGPLLSTQQRREVQDFVEVNEFGLAFETLCDILSEDGVPVSQLMLKEINVLGEDMGISKECYLIDRFTLNK